MKVFALLLFALLSFSGYSAKAQSGFYATGTVIDEATMQPMQGASVFAQNTTLGTATDADGKFKLFLPYGGYEIAVTFTGYETEVNRISSADANTALEFKLRPRQKQLEDVVIVASNEVPDGLEKYGQFFIDNFIGTTRNAAGCKILNPEVLKFYYSKRKDRLKVMADVPLQIENKSLGYNILYSLDSFSHEYATQVSIYTGNPLFSEIGQYDSLQQAVNWLKARNASYHGSVLEFMRSLYQKDLKEKGYEIQFLATLNGQEKAFPVKDMYDVMHYQKDDSTGVLDVKPNVQRVGILYKKGIPPVKYREMFPAEPKSFQFSSITFPKDEAISIEPNGYFYDQNSLSISGYWSWVKVADLLPYDFNPSE